MMMANFKFEQDRDRADYNLIMVLNESLTKTNSQKLSNQAFQAKHIQQQAKRICAKKNSNQPAHTNQSLPLFPWSDYLNQ